MESLRGRFGGDVLRGERRDKTRRGRRRLVVVFSTVPPKARGAKNEAPLRCETFDGGEKSVAPSDAKRVAFRSDFDLFREQMMSNANVGQNGCVIKERQSRESRSENGRERLMSFSYLDAEALARPGHLARRVDDCLADGALVEHRELNGNLF